MFSKRNALVVLCVSLALMQSCRRESRSPLDLTLEHEVFPQPPRVGRVTITLIMTDGLKRPVTRAYFRLEANMSHPGMAPIFAEATETAPGRYQSILELSMAGDWYVVVQGALADGRNLEHKFDIKGVVPAEP